MYVSDLFNSTRYIVIFSFRRAPTHSRPYRPVLGFIATHVDYSRFDTVSACGERRNGTTEARADREPHNIYRFVSVAR